MECKLKIGSKCRGEKYHLEPCGRLRPFICEERRRMEKALRMQKKQIKVGRADELGIGA